MGSILFCEDWFREFWHKHGYNAEIVEKQIVGRTGEFVALTMSIYWSGSVLTLLYVVVSCVGISSL